MKKTTIIALAILSIVLLVISGCSQNSEVAEKTVDKTAETNKVTNNVVVKQPIPGVNKFIAPKDNTLGVPENKNLQFTLGNDGTASSDRFKVEIVEQIDLEKISAYLPGGEFYTISEGSEKKIGFGIKAEDGALKGSAIKFNIKVTNDGQNYASGSFTITT